MSVVCSRRCALTIALCAALVLCPSCFDRSGATGGLPASVAARADELPVAPHSIVDEAPTGCSSAQPAARPTRLLGIFGGMGPEATANLYAEIVRLTPAHKDQDHIPTIIYSLPQVPDRTTAIRNGSREPVPYLVEGVTRLERSGASLIVIPCNTAHFFYDDMQRAVKIPIVHMIRETADAVVARHPQCKTVGLLATSGTIQSGLYEKELRARGLTVLCPEPGMQEACVMKAVYGIKAGGDKKESEDLLYTAGKSLEEKGAQVIVLGCTEIPLAFNPQRATVPVVNATRVLAEAAIREYRQAK
jgi:aspartate racemase